MDNVITAELKITGNLSGELTIGGGGSTPVLEDVTVKSGSTQQTVTAGEGYDGIGEVTVEAIALQNKTVTPSASQQTVTADTGYDGLGTVTVEASGGGGGANYTQSVSFSGGIGDYMFANCTWLESFVSYLGNFTMEIGQQAFNGCTGLKTVKLPTCQRIKGNAFRNCTDYDLYVGASTAYGSNVVEITNGDVITTLGSPKSIHVPDSMLDTYKNDSVWGALASIMVGDYNF